MRYMFLSFLLALLLCCVLLSCRRTEVVPEKIQNKYSRILQEYDIHPPELKCGYPLWYEFDATRVSAVIFLKHKVPGFVPVDEMTYVAQPTQEHAQLIFERLPDTMTYQKFYIVPDSSLKWAEVEKFLRDITPIYLQSNIFLVGNNGFFSSIEIEYFPWEPGIVACPRNSSFLDISMNRNKKFLIDRRPMPYDSIVDRVTWFHRSDRYHPANPNRAVISEDFIKRSLDGIKYEEKRDSAAKDGYNKVLSAIHLAEYKKQIGLYKHLVSQYKTFATLSGCAILVDIPIAESSVGDYYKVLNQINLATCMLRHKSSLQWFGVGYIDLFHSRRKSELDLLRAEYPDLVRQLVSPYDNTDEW